MGEWNTMEVLWDGVRFEVKLNSQTTVAEAIQCQRKERYSYSQAKARSTSEGWKWF